MGSLYQHIRGLFLSGDYSDFKISCGDKVFPVHRSIISQVPIYREQTRNRESTRIRVEGKDPAIVYKVLQFLYNGNYDDEEYPNTETPSPMVYRSPQEVDEKLRSLPCLLQDEGDWAHGNGEDEFEDGDAIEEEPSESGEDELDEESDGDLGNIDNEKDSIANGNTTPNSAGPRSLELRLQVDSGSKVIFSNHNWSTSLAIPSSHNLWTSLRVYVMAGELQLPALKLLARDRFYRTAEKVLLYDPIVEDGLPKPPSLQLVETVYQDFGQVIDELYETVPESDETMRIIPTLLIAARYHEDTFRDHMRPILARHPQLTLSVLECMMRNGGGLLFQGQYSYRAWD